MNTPTPPTAPGKTTEARLQRIESRICKLMLFYGCDIKEVTDAVRNKIIVTPGQVVVTTPSVSLGEINTAIRESGCRGKFSITVAGHHFGETQY